MNATTCFVTSLFIMNAISHDMSAKNVHTFSQLNQDFKRKSQFVAGLEVSLDNEPTKKSHALLLRYLLRMLLLVTTCLQKVNSFSQLIQGLTRKSQFLAYLVVSPTYVWIHKENHMNITHTHKHKTRWRIFFRLAKQPSSENNRAVVKENHIRLTFKIRMLSLSVTEFLQVAYTRSLHPRLSSVSWKHTCSQSFRLIPSFTHPLPGSPWRFC